MNNFLTGLVFADSTNSNAMMGARLFVLFFIIYLLIIIGIYIYTSLAVMSLAKKIGTEPAWLAWIPVANYVLMSMMAGMHWWPILLLIPAMIFGMIGGIFQSVVFLALYIITLLTLVVFSIIWLWKIFKKVGRPGWWSIAGTVCSFIGLAILFTGDILLIIIGILLIFVGIILSVVLLGVAAWGKGSITTKIGAVQNKPIKKTKPVSVEVKKPKIVLSKKTILITAIVIAIILLGIFTYTLIKRANYRELSSYYKIVSMDAPYKVLDDIGLTASNFPQLDGATATQPIRVLIACEAFNMECEWYKNTDGEMFLRTSPDSTSLISSNDYYNTLDSKVEKNSKTHDAYLDIIRGKVDIIVVSTKPSDDELKVAQRRNVNLELVPIGMDGLIFIVSGDSAVESLKTSDIVDIYSGKVNNWKTYTGIDVPIVAYRRQANSGSQELMNKLVMKDVAMDSDVEAQRVINMMGQLIEEVRITENSLGYSLYYYKNTMIDKAQYGLRDNLNVKLLSIDGIAPNPETISTQAYPHVFYIYAVTRADEPKDSKAYEIKKWLTSPEGQELIKKAGYVNVR